MSRYESQLIGRFVIVTIEEFLLQSLYRVILEELRAETYSLASYTQKKKKE